MRDMGLKILSSRFCSCTIPVIIISEFIIISHEIFMEDTRDQGIKHGISAFPGSLQHSEAYANWKEEVENYAASFTDVSDPIHGLLWAVISPVEWMALPNVYCHQPHRDRQELNAEHGTGNCLSLIKSARGKPSFELRFYPHATKWPSTCSRELRS